MILFSFCGRTPVPGGIPFRNDPDEAGILTPAAPGTCNFIVSGAKLVKAAAGAANVRNIIPGTWKFKSPQDGQSIREAILQSPVFWVLTFQKHWNHATLPYCTVNEAPCLVSLESVFSIFFIGQDTA